MEDNTSQKRIDDVERVISKDGTCNTKISLKREERLMRGQRFKLLPEFRNSTNPVSMILPEFSIVDSCLKLDPIKCTTGPVEHVEFKSDGTMIWYELARSLKIFVTKQTSTKRTGTKRREDKVMR